MVDECAAILRAATYVNPRPEQVRLFYNVGAPSGVQARRQESENYDHRSAAPERLF